MRLGDLLVARGVLTETQRDLVLAEQTTTGRPFGALAEELFGVEPTAVEQAWAVQYAAVAERVNPAEECILAETVAMLDARQAWQFGLIPVGEDQGEVVLATTPRLLARAMRFASWRLDQPSRFLICEEHQLAQALQNLYPMPGMTALPDLARAG
jgi:hypothetical protein